MRHIKRYEECETHSVTQVTPVRHPIFLKEDNVPYPREDAEDRSYEHQMELEAEIARKYGEQIAQAVHDLCKDAVEDPFTELLKEAH